MRVKNKVINFLVILVALITILGLSGLNLADLLSFREGVVTQDDNNIVPMNEKYISSKDDKKISFDLYEKENPVGWLVLSHMMPATKESWSDFAQKFQNLGYESIAIDLRGHGKSDGGPSGYLNFSDEQHQESILDLEAAVNYLINNRGAAGGKVFLIGASIGANLSLQYLSEHPEIKKVVLLSAGLNYRGLETEPPVKKLKEDQEVFFVTSKDDNNNAVENQKLYAETPQGVKKDIQIYEIGGHGTDILANQPEFLTLISNFLQ